MNLGGVTRVSVSEGPVAPLHSQIAASHPVQEDLKQVDIRLKAASKLTLTIP